jgi:2-hydroxy-3-oxopropionate reductase
MKKKVGFIGLGVMGSPMAKNLLRAGYEMYVCDINSDVGKEFHELSANIVELPCDVAKASDVVITMLPDSPDVEAVYLAEDGLISGAHPNLILIDSSTIDPIITRKIAQAASKAAVSMIDAPVGGGPPNAIQGNLIMLVGGDPSVIDSCRDILETVGERIIHAGPIGCGEILKLSNNLLVAIYVSSLVEGFSLAKISGLEMEKLLDLIKGNLPRITEALSKRIIERNFEQGFRTILAQKDVRLALRLAQKNNIALPFGALINEMFQFTINKGLGDMDFTSLFSLYEN